MPITERELRSHFAGRGSTRRRQRPEEKALRAFRQRHTSTVTYLGPEDWNVDQLAMHRASTLDEAFHHASSLTGGWYHRAVVIYYRPNDANESGEEYHILPHDAPAPEGFDRLYRIERV